LKELERIDPQSGSTLASLRNIVIYPANNFVTSRDTLLGVILADSGGHGEAGGLFQRDRETAGGEAFAGTH
jgi:hypothetical protein